MISHITVRFHDVLIGGSTDVTVTCTMHYLGFLTDSAPQLVEG